VCVDPKDYLCLSEQGLVRPWESFTSNWFIYNYCVEPVVFINKRTISNRGSKWTVTEPSKKPAWKQVESRARLIIQPWKWRRYIPPKRRLTLNGLHGVISQKMVLFITTAVRTSNLLRLIINNSDFFVEIRLPLRSTNAILVWLQNNTPL
jgi:hypothetical protein